MRALRLVGRVWAGLLAAILVCAVLLGVVRLVVPFFDTPPTVVRTLPAHGAGGVAPRTSLQVYFAGPMNPRSVEQALTFDPRIPAVFRWDAGNTTLTISPTVALQPETRYTLLLGPSARSRLLRPLATPLAVAFTTSSAPVVTLALPADGSSDVALDTPIVLSFDRPMADANTADSLPHLLFDPPLSGMATWVTSSTVVFRPDTPLLPATAYRATLDAGLRDAAGGALSEPFAWQFATPAPSLLRATPSASVADVPPRTPLVLRFSQPFGLDQLRAGLTISPTVAGALDATTLPDATQVVTFTPQGGWQPGTVYTATLATLLPQTGSLPLTPPAPLSFRTAPLPQVVGRFPGEGQTLPPGQDLRLIFSTPVDGAALQNALVFDPPVDGVQVLASGVEARVVAPLQSGTPYTVTLQPGLLDRNGAATNRAYQFRFSAGPAAPLLRAVGAQAHLLRLPAASDAVPLQLTNISGLANDLYALDEAALVRALGFGEADWQTFAPERFGQTLVRSWFMPVALPLNQATNQGLSLRADDGTLPGPGGYYLRVRTPEGRGLDLLLVRSDARLVVQSGSDALVWATTLDGVPLPDLPVALYRQGAQVRSGRTDPAGVWRATGVGGDSSVALVAVANGPQLALAASTAPSRLTSAQQRGVVAADRLVYHPGDTLLAAGFLDRANGDQATLTLRPEGTTERLREVPVRLDATGAFSTSLSLPADSAPGRYTLQAALGGNTFATVITVSQPEPGVRLVLDAPAQVIGGAPLQARALVVSKDGLPLPGIRVAWSLAPEGAAPDQQGFTVGDPALPPPSIGVRSGAGVTGKDGALTLTLTDTLVADHPLPFRLEMRAVEANRTIAQHDAPVLFAPADTAVGIDVPGRVFTAQDRPDVAIRTTTPAGQPLPLATVQINIVRRVGAEMSLAGGSNAQSNGTLVYSGTVTADANGRAALPLDIVLGGEYRIQATLYDASGRGVVAAETFWVTAPDFDNWPLLPDGGIALIADRDKYAAGDTARILVAAPITNTNALVSLSRRNGLEGNVATLTQGALLGVALPADEPAPTVQVDLPQTGRAVPLHGVLAMPVQVPPPLVVQIQANAATYQPGSAATITVATTRAGSPRPAEVHLRLADEKGYSPAALFWATARQTDANGVITATLPLSDAARLRLDAWAAMSNDAPATASTSLDVVALLDVVVAAPPSIRAGDVITVTATVRNGTAGVRNTTAAFVSTGFALGNGTTLRQHMQIGPNSSATASWQVTALAVQNATVQVSATDDAGHSAVARQGIAVLPDVATVISEGGTFAEGQASLDVALPGPPGRWKQAELRVAPSIAALVADVVAAIPQHGSLLDDAARLRLHTTFSTTLGLDMAAAERLVMRQHTDGGWGWTTDAPSDSAATALVMEALHGSPVRAATIEAGVARLTTFASDETAPTAERAEALRVLALYNRADPATIVALAGQENLDAPTLAALLLAAPEAAQTPQLVEQLLATAQSDGGTTSWPGSEGHTPTATTALAALALHQAAPQTQVLPAVRRWLAANGTLYGPPTDAAAALVALHTLGGERPSSGVRVMLDRATLLQTATTPMTSTAHIPLDTAQLSSTATLTVQGQAYVRVLRGAAATPSSSSIALVRSYLDQQTGQPIRGPLVVGQTVQVQLHVVALQPQALTLIEDTLPAGATLIDWGTPSSRAGGSNGHVRFVAALPDKGVYHFSYTMRVLSPGQFAAPPALVRLPDGRVLAVSEGNSIAIIAGT